MRISAALEGDLKRFLADELKAAEAAVTAGVRAATEGLKQDLRRQIVGAGLGQRLASTWRGLATVPMFILVPQVTVRKRLDVAAATDKWIAELPRLVVRSWQEPGR